MYPRCSPHTLLMISSIQLCILHNTYSEEMIQCFRTQYLFKGEGGKMTVIFSLPYHLLFFICKYLIPKICQRIKCMNLTEWYLKVLFLITILLLMD